MNRNSKDTHKNDWQLGRILIGRREKSCKFDLSWMRISNICISSQELNQITYICTVHK